jgi:hypothetical protein
MSLFDANFRMDSEILSKKLAEFYILVFLTLCAEKNINLGLFFLV